MIKLKINKISLILNSDQEVTIELCPIINSLGDVQKQPVRELRKLPRWSPTKEAEVVIEHNPWCPGCVSCMGTNEVTKEVA